jgi:hypothetical protein
LQVGSGFTNASGGGESPAGTTRVVDGY